jgi:hypothetical protein
VVGANTTDYVLDQSMFVRELLNGTVKATYLAGPRGPEYRRDDQAGAIRWYVCDGLGSVVGEVGAGREAQSRRLLLAAEGPVSQVCYNTVRSAACLVAR